MTTGYAHMLPEGAVSRGGEGGFWEKNTRIYVFRARINKTEYFSCCKRVLGMVYW